VKQREMCFILLTIRAQILPYNKATPSTAKESKTKALGAVAEEI